MWTACLSTIPRTSSTNRFVISKSTPTFPSATERTNTCKKLNKLAYKKSLGHTSFIVERGTACGSTTITCSIKRHPTRFREKRRDYDTDRRRIRDIANALTHTMEGTRVWDSAPTHPWIITAPRRPRQSACAFHVRHGVFETDRKLLRTRRVQTGERVQQHTLHGRQRSQHDRRSTTSAMASSARPYAYRAVRRVGQDSEIITNKIIFGYRNNSCSIEQPP